MSVVQSHSRKKVAMKHLCALPRFYLCSLKKIIVCIFLNFFFCKTRRLNITDFKDFFQLCFMQALSSLTVFLSTFGNALPYPYAHNDTVFNYTHPFILHLSFKILLRIRHWENYGVIEVDRF